MMSLFSVFDPISYFGIGLNWFIILLVAMAPPLKYYNVGSTLITSFCDFSAAMNSMFKEVAYPSYLGVSFLSVGVFLYLCFTNLLGLFPFVFTSSAHPMVTMGWGAVFWLSFFFMGWVKNFKKSAAHLVPEGSPMMLSPVLVLIESISHLMRPFTLSIRLAANMMAGHLIVGLLASISLINMFGFMSSMFLQSMLLILELAVAVIQGFVFSILILLYALEYY